MRLSEVKNEEALEVVADILEPLSDVLGDKALRFNIENRKWNNVQLASYILKHFPKQIIRILARLDGTPEAEYSKNIIEMTKDLLDVLNDEDFKGFFGSQGQ